MTSKLIKQIRSALGKSGIDAFFVSNQSNVSFLSGFKGLSPGQREAFLLISKKSLFFITFATYKGLFSQKNSGFEELYVTPFIRLTEILESVIKREKIKVLGFEKSGLSYAEYENFNNKLDVKFKAITGIIEKYRSVKNDREIENIKKSAEITDRAFSFALKEIKKNITEKELALKIEFFIKKNSENIAFVPIVAFNQNAAIPHYLPSDNVSLEKNSLILIDIGSRINGYCSDLSRVVFFGPPSDRKVKIYTTVLKAQEIALSAIKPGSEGKKIDQLARNYIEKSGFPAYEHGLGHGVGRDIHENPRLGPNSSDILLENMVFTVEPGIYLPAETGVRIEDLVVLKKDGPEFLSKSTKEIIIL